MTIPGYSISDISAIKSLPTALLTNGHALLCRSVNAWFSYNSTSTAAADDVSVLLPASGVGRWFKLEAKNGSGGSSQLSKNIESISTTKTLTLSSEYFQFLTPTASLVVVKLPSITSIDYFSCEIINAGTGTNALNIQEFDGTNIITLSNLTSNRSIYVFWDSSEWAIFERAYY